MAVLQSVTHSTKTSTFQEVACFQIKYQAAENKQQQQAFAYILNIGHIVFLSSPLQDSTPFRKARDQTIPIATKDP